jgi:cytochrome c553
MKRSRVSSSAPAIAGSFVAILLACILPGAESAAAGSAEAGQAKAIVCAACHGVDGNSLNPEWPSLAGQNEAYLVRSLQAFKSGERSNVLMTAQAAPLSDQDMADLAAFFASRPRQTKTADPGLATAGERLYRGGNKETGVSACIACHGPTGSGNAPAGYPAIGSQHATYSAAQLKAYRAGQRTSDPNQMMRNTAVRMTDTEIDAVASYIQGLH